MRRNLADKHSQWKHSIYVGLVCRQALGLLTIFTSVRRLKSHPGRSDHASQTLLCSQTEYGLRICSALEKNKALLTFDCAKEAAGYPPVFWYVMFISVRNREVTAQLGHACGLQRIECERLGSSSGSVTNLVWLVASHISVCLILSISKIQRVPFLYMEVTVKCHRRYF